MKAAPEPFLTAIAPYREDVVVCVECLFTWYCLADLGAPEGMPCVLGHALSRNVIPGGKARHDKIDAHKIAVLLRGGLRPQADVYPTAMRATRHLLRRQMHLTRQRAELRAHIQQTNSRYNRPPIGTTLAYKANRDGVAERFPKPAVQKSIAVDLALIGHYGCLRTDLALELVQTGKAHVAQTFYRRRSLPGIGKSLALVLRECKSSSPMVGWSSASKNPLASGTALGRQDRQRLPHMGVLGSRRPVFAEQAGGPKLPRAPGEQTWLGQSLNGFGPYIGARRLLHVETRYRVRYGHILQPISERST
jgi:hypothetical protein